MRQMRRGAGGAVCGASVGLLSWVAGVGWDVPAPLQFLRQLQARSGRSDPAVERPQMPNAAGAIDDEQLHRSGSGQVGATLRYEITSERSPLSPAHTVVITLQAFPLETIEDVKRFERCLDEFVSARTRLPALRHFSLVAAMEALRANESNGGRLFAALADLRISFALLECDQVALGRLINRVIALETSGLDQSTEQQAFDIRMEIQAHGNSFTLRCRSLWDKLMGILVLHFCPQDYDRFISSKSKKAAFRKIMANVSALPDGFIDSVERFMQGFDDRIRTGEAHGTGSLRKSSFTWARYEEGLALGLYHYWNFVNHVVLVVGALFDISAREKLIAAQALDEALTAPGRDGDVRAF